MNLIGNSPIVLPRLVPCANCLAAFPRSVQTKLPLCSRQRRFPRRRYEESTDQRDLRKIYRGELVIPRAIFGVGAPEAVLVVVVALVVFGPKGLAEAAKGMGQAIRAFSPTIRELAEVSTDLRSTLEKEIGLNEIQQDLRDAVDSPIETPFPKVYGYCLHCHSTKIIYKAKDDASSVDPDIESKRAESARLAWSQSGEQSGEVLVENTKEVVVESQEKAERETDLSDLSIEELEAELNRRRKTPET